MKNEKTIEHQRSWTEQFRTAYELRKRRVESPAGQEDRKGRGTSAEDAAAREVCARHVRPFDGGIEAGQVRLLWGVESIAYALVARKWGETSWLVIPFSPFSAPATDTELKMRSGGGVGLRVLQLWNAFSLLEETLAKSWLVHTLPAEDVRDALDAWRWSVGRGELTGDQLNRTGLPITDRRDSRVEYRKGEVAKFAKLLAEDFALGEQRALEAVVRKVWAGMKIETCLPSRMGVVGALAAAVAPKSVSGDCRIAGFNGVVHVACGASGELAIRVFGADGEHSDALDGWHVFGSGPALLGTIEGSACRCRVPDNFDGILALSDPNGEHLHPLQAAEN